MKIYLTRHGQTEWNLEGRVQGRLNSDLTVLGKNQAAWLGKRMADIPLDAILSSTSGRAIETAKIIRGNRNIPMESIEELCEINLGHWQGMLHEDVEGNYQDDYHHFWYKPEAFEAKSQESFEDIIERAGNCLNTLVRKYPDQDIMIVSHGVFLKALLAYVKSLDIKDFWSGAFMKSACLSVIEYYDNRFKIALEGDTSHYPVENQQ